MTDPRPAPPPLARRVPPPAPAAARNGEPAPTFAVTKGRSTGGPQRILIYGTGGIGKSSLATTAPNPIFLDLEMGTRNLAVDRIHLSLFADLRACLQSTALDNYASVVLDSITTVEEMAVAHTLATVLTERGELVSSVEGYGFGKGYQHVYETVLLLMQDLDRHVRAGRNVILLAHDCVNDVPNPAGENFIRFEPRLQSPKSGKSSIRHRIIEWADHVLFVGYDVAATKAGKGIGGGTRTIYPAERPAHIAKSRSLPDEPIIYASPDDGAVWPLIFGGVSK